MGIGRVSHSGLTNSPELGSAVAWESCPGLRLKGSALTLLPG